MAGIYSCKKINGINNNNVVEAPYSLYFSDTAGTLFVTTDGKNINKVVFPPDGKPNRAIVTSAGNLLFAKSALYISTNNGENFNDTYDSLTQTWSVNQASPGVTRPLSYTVNGVTIDFNQSMIINIPTWNDRLYIASQAEFDPVGNVNYLGLMRSDNNGILGSWITDSYDNNVVGQPPVVGVLPVRMTSFTQLANGYLCGLAYEHILAPSTITNRIRYVRNFCKKTAPYGVGTNWKELTSNPDNVSTIFQGFAGSGHPLPPYLGKIDTSFFTLGHYNNRLIAIDNKGEYGAWYSDDFGSNWFNYSTGLPTRTPLLCISAPFEEVCLIGTDSAGLYILNQNTGVWQQNNSGLGSNLIVRNIAFKETLYKNGTQKKYIYLATNRGIYQSTDGGLNWTMTIAGNYVAVY